MSPIFVISSFGYIATRICSLGEDCMALLSNISVGMKQTSSAILNTSTIVLVYPRFVYVKFFASAVELAAHPIRVFNTELECEFLYIKILNEL